MGDEQAETLEQTVRLEAIGASMRFEGPDEESQEERWRLAVRPLVEIIADLRSAATRTNEAGNSEIEKLNREIYCLRADLTEARDSGQAYADKLTAVQRAKTDQAIEINRLKGELIDMNAERNEYHRAAKRCADEAREARADLTRERETVRKLLSDNAALETTVDVLAGRLAARGQS